MKRTRFIFPWLLITVIINFGCSQQNQQTQLQEEQDDTAVILELYNNYVRAAESRDVDGIMAVWDEDGMRSEPGLPTIIGKENLRERFEELLLAPVDHKITPLGEPLVEISGDLAVTYRTVTLTSTPRDGSPPVQQDMKVLTVFRRQADGSMKAYIDCINFHPTWSMDSIPDALTEDNPYY